MPVLSAPPPEFVPFEPLDDAPSNRVVVVLPADTAPYVPVEQGPANVRHVVVVGDSLTVGARNFLERLARESGYELQIDAVSGRKTSAGASALKNLVVPPGATIVAALGTNDSNAGPSFRASVDDFMAVVPPSSPVVWLTSYRTKPLDNVARALADAQLSYPRLTIADWVAVLQSRKDWLSGDDVHYTPAGYEAFARFVSRAATNSPG